MILSKSDIKLVIGMMTPVSAQGEGQTGETGAEDTRREAAAGWRDRRGCDSTMGGTDSLQGGRGKRRCLKESSPLGDNVKTFVEKMGKWEVVKFKSVSKEINQLTFIYSSLLSLHHVDVKPFI